MKKYLILALILSLFIPSICFGAAEKYVTVAGAGTKAGTSWANAFGFAEWETDCEGVGAPPAVGDNYWVESGTYTLTGLFSCNFDGTQAAPLSVIGVKSGTTNEPPVFSDWAFGDNRPLISAGGNNFQFDNFWILRNFRYTGTGSEGIRIDTSALVYNVSSINTSTSTGREGIIAGNEARVIYCETVSTNGVGIKPSQGGVIYGSYMHDSVSCFQANGNDEQVVFSILSSCVNGADALTRDGIRIHNNTIHNSTTGILSTDGQSWFIENNIIDSNTTGANFTTAVPNNYWDYNNWTNNDTDVTNVVKGNNATSGAPGFTDVGVVTGTAATTSSGVLTAGGAKDFSGVTANVDYCWIKSGTGVTANEFHLITSVNDGADTLTLSPDPGDSAAGDIVWSVTTGHDFSVGTGVKATAFPGEFQGALTTGYLDQGAVQRIEPAGGGGGAASFTFVQ